MFRFTSANPRTINLTSGTDGLRFNFRVKVDTMFTRSNPVIHMVYLATHLSEAEFLSNQTSGEVWGKSKDYVPSCSWTPRTFSWLEKYQIPYSSKLEVNLT